VSYSDGDPDIYQLPLAFTTGNRAADLAEHQRHTVITRLRVRDNGNEAEGVLYDATVEEGFCNALLDVIERRRRRSGALGRLRTSRTRQFRAMRGNLEDKLKPSLLGAEQSNTSVVYGDRLIVKLFRRLDQGVNPDLEIGRFLTERTSFSHMPPLGGAIEYEHSKGEPLTLAVLQGFVPNQGDAWEYTLDALDEYFERVLARPADERQPAVPAGTPLTHVYAETPPQAKEVIGAYLELARLLGQRTAELHLALASRSDDAAFAPEPINTMYRRSVYESSRTRLDQAFTLLRRRLSALPEHVRPEARAVLGQSKQIEQRLRSVVDRKVGGLRIRCHGDYHLGQVLYTGKDFLIMDFEGEPARPISERQLKRSPLRDVGGMLRSFHYAAVSALIAGRVRPEDVPILEPRAEVWYLWVAAYFLRAYLDLVADADLVPEGEDELAALLDLCVIDKALYELEYELNNRPDWVRIPLRGIASLIESSTEM